MSSYLLNVTFLDHKISEAPRVLAWSHVFIVSVDKALRTYCEGRQKLLEYVSSENKTSRLIAGLGDFETCINSTKRCLRLIDRLARDPESPDLEKTRRRLLKSVDAEVTGIRDAIEHMDERIAANSGEGGKPQLLFVTPDGTTLTIDDSAIQFERLAVCLRQLHALAKSICSRSA